MSARATFWVSRQPLKLHHGSARVLLVLCSFADDDGTNCFPSLVTVAEHAQMDRKGVIRCVADLQAKGLVARVAGKGRGKSTAYTIIMAPLTGDASSGSGQTNGVHDHAQAVPPYHSLFGAPPEATGPMVPPIQERSGPVIPPISPVKGPMVVESGPMAPPDSVKTQVSKEVRLQVDVVQADPTRPPPAPPAPVEPAVKAHRLPDGWRPSLDDRTFAERLGIDPEAMADEFCDYWHALPGAKARKLNWSMTWRNRCRDQSKRPGVRGMAGAAPQQEFRNGFIKLAYDQAMAERDMEPDANDPRFAPMEARHARA